MHQVFATDATRHWSQQATHVQKEMEEEKISGGKFVAGSGGKL